MRLLSLTLGDILRSMPAEQSPSVDRASVPTRQRPDAEHPP